MLLPNKHIRFSESLIGLGGFVLEKLTKPSTIDELWGEFCKARKSGEYPAQHSFENLVLAVDTLYAIGALKELERNTGVLVKCV